jgi:alpha-L-rhamnosidase
MDCPTRERAGWLCDSYYTSQAEFGMTGRVEVEPVFMENYLLYPQGSIVPKGMLPMCYPGEHLNGDYIPQWAMWYVLELEQYLLRDASANREDYHSLCYELLDYFRGYENEAGFLERLPSWNFVEWSAANDWVQDVNYPTNMLYVKVQEIIATLYLDEKLMKRSRHLKKLIIRDSFNGTLFIDHAVRNEQGFLVKKEDISEVCQYYAARFLRINLYEEKYSCLRKAILEEFGPNRSKTGSWKEVEPANALMGIYLRMELLSELNEREKLKNEIKDYFGTMALKTGTLWEHKFMASSLNHGFASFVGAVIRKID